MNAPITYGSVCSGIEAATVAMEPFGWRAAWFAEVEPFPCAVLAHHYPAVPNLGDMTKIAAKVAAGEVAAPVVLVGGTPCQAFSVAGMRAGLSDARGALTLSFVELADAIDTARSVRGDDPCVVWWENVPGVLSSKDNAFGCFLAGLAGEDSELVAPGGKWPNAGVVYGPKRTVAWRVLDAQYFGVAQRRRRVFVVASARDGFDPAAVLFEFEGVRRDSAPSREAGQEPAGTLASRTDGGGFPGTDEACSGYVQPVRCVEVCPTLRAGGNQTGGDRPPGTDVDTADSLIVQSVALRGREGGATAELGGDLATALRCGGGGGDKLHVLAPVAFDRSYQKPLTGEKSNAYWQRMLDHQREHGITPEMLSGGMSYRSPIAFSSKDYGADACVDLSPTLRAGGHSESHANAGVPPAIAFDSRQDPVSSAHVFGALGSSSPQAQAVCVTGDIAHTLKAEGFDTSEDGTGRGQPIVAFAENSRAELRLEGGDGSRTGALSTGGGKPGQGVPMIAGAMAVRRLTPRECEALQAFPPEYTKIPYRKKPAEQCPDGPRYKALGNSMCVYNMRWIGRRIDRALRACTRSISQPMFQE